LNARLSFASSISGDMAEDKALASVAIDSTTEQKRAGTGCLQAPAVMLRSDMDHFVINLR